MDERLYPGEQSEQLDLLMRLYMKGRVDSAVPKFLASTPTPDQILAACLAFHRLRYDETLTKSITQYMALRTRQICKMHPAVLMEAAGVARTYEWLDWAMKRVGHTSDPMVAEKIVWACAYLPDVGLATESLIRFGQLLSTEQKTFLRAYVFYRGKQYADCEREARGSNAPRLLVAGGEAVLNLEDPALMREYAQRLNSAPKYFVPATYAHLRLRTKLNPKFRPHFNYFIRLYYAEGVKTIIENLKIALDAETRDMKSPHPEVEEQAGKDILIRRSSRAR